MTATGLLAPHRRQPAAPHPRLEVRDLTATYVERGERLLALADLSLSVAAGEFVALIGPSGSGKSTLLDLVAGLIAQDEGEILLDGESLSAARRLGRSAYMRQRDLLLPWRTAAENAALALEAGGMPKARARTAATARFPEFGLAGFERAYPNQLSGGMRQRVAFLRTVLPNRPLLLLDEPFGALDALTRVEMQSWLLAMWEWERQSVLLVSHDVDEAVFLADRVIVLTPRPGRIALVELIGLDRPRRRPVVTSAAFVAHKAAILAALGVLDEDGK
ncbi:MAG: ABC transporter ATP-binding protein [Chloroflexota bacterium]|nr:ABC transporter ATP-binding protein [Chloroflexota bacterium]